MGSSTAGFASIGSTGGAMAKSVGERIEPFDEIGIARPLRPFDRLRVVPSHVEGPGTSPEVPSPSTRGGQFTASGRDGRMAVSRLRRHGEWPDFRFRLRVGERTELRGDAASDRRRFAARLEAA